MWNLGFPELVIIFIVALVIFGPRKLPELGRSLGKGLTEFKRASNELKRTWEDEVEAVKHEVDVEDEELKKLQSDLK
jgi:TatA/E family protein of Tat protein translocase